MLFESGATEVHVRISSPPIVSPCFYGIDMAGEDELIAAGREVEDVREEIGATSLAYLSLDGLQEATRRPADSFCRACLTKSYPTRIPRTSASRSSASSAPPRSSSGCVSPDACWLVEASDVQDGRLQVGHVEHRSDRSDPTRCGYRRRRTARASQ